MRRDLLVLSVIIIVVLVGAIAWFTVRRPPAPVRALSYSPKVIEMSAKLLKTAEASVTLKNEGKDPMSVTLSLVNISGEVSPESFTLGPGESKVVSISAVGESVGIAHGSLIVDYQVEKVDIPIIFIIKAYKLAICFDIGGRGDLGFNDLAYLGGEMARRDFGVEVVYVQPRTEADYLPLLRELASSREYDLIVGVGWLLTDAIHTVAQEYPDQYFAIVDSMTDDPNVRGILFKEHEGSALVGLLAGLITENNIVGAVLGMDIPVLYKFETGYYFGINYAENLTGKDITILYKYTGSFIDRPAGKATAEGMIAQGADIIYNIAGMTGLGVLDACHDYCVEHGLKFGPPFAIGVDANQDWIYPGHVIASMEKRVDLGVYFAMRDIIYGNFTGGPIWYGLKEGGVGISSLDTLGAFMEIAKFWGVELPMSPEETIKVWKEMRERYADAFAKVEEFKEKLIKGEIAIPWTMEEMMDPEIIKQIRARYGAGVPPS